MICLSCIVYSRKHALRSATVLHFRNSPWGTAHRGGRRLRGEWVCRSEGPTCANSPSFFLLGQGGDTGAQGDRGVKSRRSQAVGHPTLLLDFAKTAPAATGAHFCTPFPLNGFGFVRIAMPKQWRKQQILIFVHHFHLTISVCYKLLCQNNGGSSKYSFSYIIST